MSLKLMMIEGCDFGTRTPTGGQTTYFQNLIKHVDAKIYLVGYGTNDSEIGIWQDLKILNKNLKYLSIGKPNYEIENLSLMPGRIKFLLSLLTHKNEIKKPKPDVIIFRSPEVCLFARITGISIPLCFIPAGANNPIVASKYRFIRNKVIENIYEKILLKPSYTKSKIVIAINNDCKLLAKKYGVTDVDFIPLGVDDKKFFSMDKNKCRKYFRIADIEYIILFVGRIEDAKDIPLLIESFKYLNMRLGTTSKLILAGQGSQVKNLKKFSRKLNIENDVIFLGLLEHDKLPILYNTADIFVMTSKMEGLPNVLLEAMACKVPVACTPIGGIVEVIEDGKNGYLFSNRNPFKMAERLYKILKSNNDIILKNARETIVNKYSFAKISKKMEELIQKSLEEK